MLTDFFFLSRITNLCRSCGNFRIVIISEVHAFNVVGQVRERQVSEIIVFDNACGVVFSSLCIFEINPSRADAV